MLPHIQIWNSHRFSGPNFSICKIHRGQGKESAELLCTIPCAPALESARWATKLSAVRQRKEGTSPLGRRLVCQIALWRDIRILKRSKYPIISGSCFKWLRLDFVTSWSQLIYLYFFLSPRPSTHMFKWRILKVITHLHILKWYI